MLIKILLIVAILAAVAVGLRATTSATYLALRRLGLVGFAFAAVLSILFPNALTTVAHKVGVGRGADLVLYALVVTVVFVALGLHQRIQALEDKVVELTRQLALRDSDEPQS